MNVLILFWGSMPFPISVHEFGDGRTTVGTVDSISGCLQYGAGDFQRIILVGPFSEECREYIRTRLRKPSQEFRMVCGYCGSTWNPKEICRNCEAPESEKTLLAPR